MLANRGSWECRRCIGEGIPIFHLHSGILHACREARIKIHLLVVDIIDGLWAVTGPTSFSKEAPILTNWIKILRTTVDLVVVTIITLVTAIVLIAGIVLMHSS